MTSIKLFINLGFVHQRNCSSWNVFIYWRNKKFFVIHFTRTLLL